MLLSHTVRAARLVDVVNACKSACALTRVGATYVLVGLHSCFGGKNAFCAVFDALCCCQCRRAEQDGLNLWGNGCAHGPGGLGLLAMGTGGERSSKVVQDDAPTNPAAVLSRTHVPTRSCIPTDLSSKVVPRDYGTAGLFVRRAAWHYAVHAVSPTAHACPVHWLYAHYVRCCCIELADRDCVC